MHCGVEFVPSREDEQFCCAGCGHVYQLLHQQGLQRFYELREGALPPVQSAALQPRDYGWLVALGKVAEAAAGPRQAALLELDLQGITCLGCVWLIEKVGADFPGVRSIEVNPQFGRVRLRWEPGRLDLPALAARLQNFGYLLGAAGRPRGRESQALLDRLGLCAAFALNAMLFALPGYLGLAPGTHLAHLFDLLLVLFATLSLLVGGSYFLRRAYRGLEIGVLSLDVPIALGVLLAYCGSAGAWWAGFREAVYLDFVSTFLFLMLLGRWVQERVLERNRHHLLSHVPGSQTVEVAAPETDPAHPVEPGADGDLPFVAALRKTEAELAAGDRYRLPAGQPNPVRARLAGTPATFSLEWITGEADPHLHQPGQWVSPGAIPLERQGAVLRAGESWADSLLAHLSRATETPGRDPAIERIIRWYLPSVLILAALSLVYWWGVRNSLLTGWQSAISILVVSCPCAFGVAWPLANELTAAHLRRHGLYVRRESLWPRLAACRKILFDKTGTLTLETPVLRDRQAIAALSAEERRALWHLADRNLHPVGRAVREALLPYPEAQEETGAASPNDCVTVTPGFGAVWRDSGGETWSLGKPGWRGREAGHPDRPGKSPAVTGGDSWDAEFCRAGSPCAQLSVVESLRPGARAHLDSLRKRGYELFVLSGDRPSKVQALLEQLGLPPDHGLGGLSPAEKAAWVDRLAPGEALFIGDGANDSAAFDRAACRGTPVSGKGLLEEKSDFFFLGRSLAVLPRLLEAAACRTVAVRRAGLFAVFYNIGTATVAMSGHMHPLLAAILMPLSSLTTLLLVWASPRHSTLSAKSGKGGDAV